MCAWRAQSRPHLVFLTVVEMSQVGAASNGRIASLTCTPQPRQGCLLSATAKLHSG